MVGRGGNLTWRDLVLHGKQVFAHGYVESPVSRGYQGSLDRNTLGWSAAFEIWQCHFKPTIIGNQKGFPEAGPVDGRIASADGGLGQIRDFVLDEQGTIVGPNKTSIKDHCGSIGIIQRLTRPQNGITISRNQDGIKTRHFQEIAWN